MSIFYTEWKKMINIKKLYIFNFSLLKCNLSRRRLIWLILIELIDINRINDKTKNTNGKYKLGKEFIYEYLNLSILEYRQI